jgi:hypothetical protein
MVNPTCIYQVLGQVLGTRCSARYSALCSAMCARVLGTVSGMVPDSLLGAVLGAVLGARPGAPPDFGQMLCQKFRGHLYGSRSKLPPYLCPVPVWGGGQLSRTCGGLQISSRQVGSPRPETIPTGGSSA